MLEPDHHIGHLHPRIIDIVLHFHGAPCTPQQPHERIAQRGVAQMPDVRSLIGIDVGVFDDALSAERHVWADWLDRARPERLGRCRKKCAAVKEEIDVPGARRLHPRDARNCRKREFPRDFLRDLPRSPPQPLGQLKSHRRCRLAHGNLGRTLDHHGNIFDAPLPQNFSQRRTYASFNDVIHEFSAPNCEEINNKRRLAIIRNAALPVKKCPRAKLSVARRPCSRYSFRFAVS